MDTCWPHRQASRGPIAAINVAAPKDFFVLQPADEQPPFYGLSVRTPSATSRCGCRSPSIRAISSLTACWKSRPGHRVDLGPVRRHSAAGQFAGGTHRSFAVAHGGQQAAAIGPSAASMRLTENGLPRDVHALVSAVNRGLDRLETAFDAQKRFIADAAHELRTPVTVLKAHVGILPKFEGHASSSRNRQSPAPGQPTARRGASRRAAARRRQRCRSDERRHRSRLPPRTDGDRQRPIDRSGGAGRAGAYSGARDYLFRALRNIVENALRYTPEGTTVSIVVANPPAIRVIDRGPGVPESQRHAIFRRFWQGDREANKGGAGSAWTSLLAPSLPMAASCR